MIAIVGAFWSGFFAEFAWLAWIYFAAQGWPFRAALASMAIGAFSFIGVKTSLASKWRAAALILGYGAGSYCAALIKAHL